MLTAMSISRKLSLSFLLIWDLPRTRERMRRFSKGRTAEIYSEITPGLVAFATMLGRAFEAQSVVAIVNGIYMLITKQQSKVFIFLSLGLAAALIIMTFVILGQAKAQEEPERSYYSY